MFLSVQRSRCTVIQQPCKVHVSLLLLRDITLTTLLCSKVKLVSSSSSSQSNTLFVNVRWWWWRKTSSRTYYSWDCSQHCSWCSSWCTWCLSWLCTTVNETWWCRWSLSCLLSSCLSRYSLRRYLCTFLRSLCCLCCLWKKKALLFKLKSCAFFEQNMSRVIVRESSPWISVSISFVLCLL